MQILFFLEQDRHKPIVQVEVVPAEDLHTEGVALQSLLAAQHGLADPRPAHQGLVKGGHKAAGRLHQNGVAHGHHRGHALVQQLGGHRGRGVLLGLGRLAGVQKDQRNPPLADDGRHLGGVNRLVAALGQLVHVLRVFKAQPAQADALVEHAVPIEMHHVEGLAPLLGLLQGCLQGGEGGRGQDGQFGQVAQLPDGLGHGLGDHPVVNVACALVFRTGTDQQHPDRWLGDDAGEIALAGQAAAHQHRPGPTEEIASPVVEQFPRQPQQQSGCFPRLGLLLLGTALQQAGVHKDAETALHPLGQRFPRAQHFLDAPFLGHGLVEGLPPGGQRRFHFGRPFLIHLADGPKVILFQVPAQLFGLNGAQRGLEEEAVTLHVPLRAVGRAVDQLGLGCRPTRARFFDDVGVGQSEQQFGHRTGGHGLVGSGVGGQAFTQGGQQAGQGRFQSAWPLLDVHRQGDSFAGEEGAQGGRLYPRQQQGNDGELLDAPFPLHAAGVIHLVMDPLGVEAVLADHDQHGARLANRLLDFGRELVAAAQVAGVGPDRQAP